MVGIVQKVKRGLVSAAALLSIVSVPGHAQSQSNSDVYTGDVCQTADPSEIQTFIDAVNRNDRRPVRRDVTLGMPSDDIDWVVRVQNNSEHTVDNIKIKFLDETNVLPDTWLGTGNMNVPQYKDSSYDVGSLLPRELVRIFGVETAPSTCIYHQPRAVVSWGCQLATQNSEIVYEKEVQTQFEMSLRPEQLQLNHTIRPTESGARVVQSSAVVSMRVKNTGVDINTMTFQARLSDTFVLDLDQAVQWVSDSGHSVEVDVVNEDLNQPIFQMTAEDGAVLRQRERGFLEFYVKRTNAEDVNTLQSSMDITLYDMCGSSVNIAQSTAEAPVGRPELKMRIGGPVAAAVSPMDRQQRIFNIQLENVSLTDARSPQIRLNIGEGWLATLPEGCVLSVPGEMVCTLARNDLKSGETYTIPLVVHPAPVPGSLSIAASAQTYIQDSKGFFTTNVLSEAQTHITPPGFWMDITHVDSDGTTLSEDIITPGVENDEVFFVDFNANWYSLGKQSIQNPKIQIKLPDALELMSSRILETENVSIDSASQGGTGIIVWNLEDFEENAKFSVRLKFRAKADPEQAQQKQYGILNAVSEFRKGTEVYRTQGGSIYPVQEPAHLVVPIIQPHVSIDLALDGTQPSTPLQKTFIAPGTQTVVRFRVSNLGHSDTSVSRLRLTLPPYVSLDHSTAQAIMSEGQIPDSLKEIQTVKYVEREDGSDVVEITRTDLSTLSATLLDDDETFQPVTDNKLGAGRVLSWDIPIKINDDIPPDYAVSMRAAASFLDVNEESQEVIQDYLIHTRTLSGALERTQNDAYDVRHGQTLQYRAEITLPSGKVDNLRIFVQRPDAVAYFENATYTLDDSQIACTSVQVPQIQEPQLSWSLGTCQVRAQTQISLTFDVVMQDAQPDMSAEAIKQWRQPVFDVVGAYEYRNGRNIEEVTLSLGKDVRELRGPLLNFKVTPDTFSKVDAGDEITLSGFVQNKGDEASSGVRVSLEPRPTPTSMPILACKSARIYIRGESHKATCRGVTAVSDSLIIQPGETVPFTIKVRLAQNASVDTQMTYRVRLINIENDTPVLDISPAREIGIQTRSVTRPLWSVSQLHSDTGRHIFIGSEFDLKAIYSFQEGTFDIDNLSVELSVGNAAQTGEGEAPTSPGEEAPTFEVTRALLSTTSPDIRSEMNVGGINDQLPETSVDVTDLITTQQLKDSLRIELPVGQIQTLNNSGARRSLRYVLSMNVVPVNSASLTEGRSVSARAYMRTDANNEFSSSQAVFATIAEPYVEIASTVDDLDGMTHAGERQPFRINACNRGTAPAFDLRFSVDLDPDLRFLDTAQSLLKNAQGESIGTVSYDAQERSIDVETDWGKALNSGACFQAQFTTTVQSGIPQDVGITINDVYYSSQIDGKSKYDKAYSIPQTTLRIPVTRFYAEAPAYIQYKTGEIQNIDIPFVLFLPQDNYNPLLRNTSELRQPGLQLSAESSLGLAWVFIHDLNKNLEVDPGEPLWNARQGPVDWSLQTLSFVARAQPTQALVQDAWTDTTQIKATLLGQGAQTQTAFIQTVSMASRDGERPVDVKRLMALDRNCDGSLEDETAQDALFEISKAVQVGECLRMQILYSNTSDQAKQNVKIEDAIPEKTKYIADSAVYISVPRGLTTTPVAYDDEQNVLSWNLRGTLLSDLEGIIEYTVRIDE